MSGMNAGRFHLSIVVAVLISMSGGIVARTSQNVPAKDLLGGASSLFKPPQNPSIQRRKEHPSPSPEASKGNKALGRPQSDNGDKVEDAIELGNAARDRRPPDWASAERAYRLAWKLNPRDARPYVGLGNVYFDQQRYPEAAQAYRDAIKLQQATRVGVSAGAMSMRTDTRSIGASTPTQAGQVHVYLAAAMFRQEDLAGAELELRRAVIIDPKNASWRALLGYGLFAQKRYREASAAYKHAVDLDPQNDAYKKLLTQTLEKAQEASATDAAVAKRLEGTQWEIQEVGSRQVKGICLLKTRQRLDCKLNAIKRANKSLVSWKVQDGLLKLEQSSSPIAGADLPDFFCVGKMQTDRINVECPLSQGPHEVWVKRDRN